MNPVKQFNVGYAILAAQFAIPAASYMVAPELTLDSVSRLNTALGGAPFSGSGLDPSELWHMLAVGNVATLAFMCVLLLIDVKRFLPVLPALAFLKAFSALYSLALALSGHPPFFFAVFLLDGVTTVLLVVLPLRALAVLDPPPPDADRSAPWWARALLLRPRAIERTLARIVDAKLLPPGQRAPNLWQVFLGTAAMAHRVLFRSETIGTSRGVVRATWRARALGWRALRLPFLLGERAIKPLELLGLSADEDLIVRHLLLAHHDGDQFVYDLQFLSLFPGGLERLRTEARAIVDGSHPRAAWARDLVVFDGYHESLLGAVERFLAGDLVDARIRDDADLSLTGTLMWCARMPASPRATVRAWRSLRLRFV
jgi:hypothetical protein